MKTSRPRALPCGSTLWVLLLVGFQTKAQAGPNMGGTLIVHDAGWNTTCDEIVGPQLSACAAVDNNLDPTFSHGCPTWKVYAAFPGNSQPRLKALSWGMTYDLASLYLGGVALPGLEGNIITTPDWPSSGSGVTMTFDNVQTTELVALFTFVGFTYYASQLPGVVWRTWAHPTVPSVFQDGSLVPVEDDIADFGTIGFGVPGYTPCPEPLPVPAVETSWGQLKAIYRR